MSLTIWLFLPTHRVTDTLSATATLKTLHIITFFPRIHHCRYTALYPVIARQISSSFRSSCLSKVMSCLWVYEQIFKGQEMWHLQPWSHQLYYSKALIEGKKKGLADLVSRPVWRAIKSRVNPGVRRSEWMNTSNLMGLDFTPKNRFKTVFFKWLAYRSHDFPDSYCPRWFPGHFLAAVSKQ